MKRRQHKQARQPVALRRAQTPDGAWGTVVPLLHASGETVEATLPDTLFPDTSIPRVVGPLDWSAVLLRADGMIEPFGLDVPGSRR